MSCRIALALVLALAGTTALAQSPVEPPPIADNSFLLEEAYNQEPGVIQHISLFQHTGDGAWAYAFTEEWPVGGQRHQLSVTLPLLATGEETGLGDAALNYRFQALGREGERTWFAPRLSLLLGNGSPSRGLGAGGAGLQVNLPLSVDLGERFVSHSNAGGTWIPSAESADGHEARTVSWSAGQSVIWRTSPTFNVMLELAWSRARYPAGDGVTAHEDSLYLNPGVRWAHNLRGGLQIVPGIAVPIGIGPSRGDEGVLLYLSFEHPR